MIIAKSSICSDWSVFWKFLDSQLTHREQALNSKPGDFTVWLTSLNIKELKVHVQNTDLNLPVSLEPTQVTKRL